HAGGAPHRALAGARPADRSRSPPRPRHAGARRRRQEARRLARLVGPGRSPRLVAARARRAGARERNFAGRRSLMVKSPMEVCAMKYAYLLPVLLAGCVDNTSIDIDRILAVTQTAMCVADPANTADISTGILDVGMVHAFPGLDGYVAAPVVRNNM